MYVSSVPDNAEFDFIIVGSGSAGCAVANRLTADGRHRVLLIEAGGRDNHYHIHIPVLVAHALNDARWIWPYMTEEQRHLNGRTQKWTRGRVIGGSSSINGGIFVRGDPKEYDSWRDHQGCAGWGYSDLLPIFKRLEHYPQGDPAVRGRGGPIHCTKLDRFDALSDAYLAACAEQGYRVLDDYNDGSYEGASYIQMATRRGFRNSSAVGYLRPALKRPNLTVLTRALVTRVLLDGQRATGVEVRFGNVTRKVSARREVVLSAGPMGSPQLLELSGIGSTDILQKLGIPVAHHLPGVGENLRDHPNTRLTFECALPITINDVLRSPWLKFKEGLKFAFKRTGLLSISSSTVQAHIRSDSGETQPNMVLRLQPLSGKDRYARTPQLGLDPFPGFTIGITLLRPRSVGALHIQSRDASEHPRMDPKYLSHEADAQLFLDGIHLARQLSQRPALKPLVVRETRPGPEVQDEAALLEYIRSSVQTAWHQVGTCRMGVDTAAVVDPQLRVCGIADLRVVDSSVFPTIPAANTNIPSIAVGEKGADLLLEAARA
ncbi:MAG TPA: GMC family oxidoreductase N-terminal domain-containing protein [Burkholderiales bacterium]|nr:GMC family oxidoreductase N-terminal domain-containing protein [Burkholderiales bacterium]